MLCGFVVVLWWFSSSPSLLLSIKEVLRIVDQLVSFSFLASELGSAEHEQAFSELQSIAMAVTGQHQGTFSNHASR